MTVQFIHCSIIFKRKLKTIHTINKVLDKYVMGHPYIKIYMERSPRCSDKGKRQGQKILLELWSWVDIHTPFPEYWMGKSGGSRILGNYIQVFI